MDTKTGNRSGVLAGYVSEKELAVQLNRNPRTLLRWRKLRIGPPFTMIGDRPEYNLDLAHQWVANGGTASVNKSRRGRKG